MTHNTKPAFNWSRQNTIYAAICILALVLVWWGLHELAILLIPLGTGSHDHVDPARVARLLIPLISIGSLVLMSLFGWRSALALAVVVLSFALVWLGWIALWVWNFDGVALARVGAIDYIAFIGTFLVFFFPEGGDCSNTLVFRLWDRIAPPRTFQRDPNRPSPDLTPLPKKR